MSIIIFISSDWVTVLDINSNLFPEIGIIKQNNVIARIYELECYE